MTSPLEDRLNDLLYEIERAGIEFVKECEELNSRITHLEVQIQELEHRA